MPPQTPTYGPLSMYEAAQTLDLFDMESTSLKTQLTENTRNHCDLHVGDARHILGQMPDGHFDCIVTSPPYWGLRDYGVKDQIGAETTVDEYIADLTSVPRSATDSFRRWHPLAEYWG